MKDLTNVFLMKWKNNKMRQDHGLRSFIMDTGAGGFDFMIMGAVCSSLYNGLEFVEFWALLVS